MKTLRVLIVDDEAPARRKLRRFLEADSGVEIVAEATTGGEAVQAIQSHSPDLVFLDVQMPDMSGFEVLQSIAGARPHIIFVTAHDDFALKAFEVQALDYLLKPVEPERFEKVLAHAKQQIESGTAAGLDERVTKLLQQLADKQRYPKRLLVNAAGKAFFIPVESIDWMQSSGNYIRLHVGSERYQIRNTIESFAKSLDPDQFLRVNRAQIVNLDRIREMHPWMRGEYRIILKDGIELTWARRYRPSP